MIGLARLICLTFNNGLGSWWRLLPHHIVILLWGAVPQGRGLSFPEHRNSRQTKDVQDSGLPNLVSTFNGIELKNVHLGSTICDKFSSFLVDVF